MLGSTMVLPDRTMREGGRRVSGRGVGASTRESSGVAAVDDTDGGVGLACALTPNVFEADEAQVVS